MNETINKSKIKIVDDTAIREMIITLINNQNKTISSQWAITNVLRVLDNVQFDITNSEIINKGIDYNNLCNRQLITVSKLREVGFEIHRFAKVEDDVIIKSALRAFGHAVSTAHMKEHAIVSSDYLIKVGNLRYENNQLMAVEERKLQLKALKELIQQIK